MMSRELKLALILGFAAVMVVGVLISDHMSGARQARIEERTLQTPSLALSTPSTGDYAVAPPQQPEQLAHTLPEDTPPALSAPAVELEEPPVLAMGSPVDLDDSATPSDDAGRTSSGAIGDFLAWSEKQGVRFDEITPTTPLLQTTPRNENQAPSRTLPDAATRTAGADRTHTVEEGETLWAIAEEYYGNGALYTRIEEANKGRLGKGDALYVGAKLRIPGATHVPAKAASAPTRNAFTPRKPANADRFHVVQKGETLGDIAKKTLGSAKRWPDIVKANKGTITDPDNVPAGLRIRIPEN